MPIVVVGGIKGGSGKTTIASNLVVLRTRQGRRVLLVDADEQKSISDWVEHRESQNIKTAWTTISLLGPAVRTQILKMSADYDDVIIDTGGRDTTSQRAALTIADLFLAPFQPRSFDVWTISSVVALLEEIKAVNPKLRAFSVINRGDSKGSDNQSAAEILEEHKGQLTHLPCSICQRKAFANAAAEGLSVVELATKDTKALFEIEQLCKILFLSM